MAKATHYGTCQLCGRLQKAPNGVLSNHGYTIDHGFFSGVCSGAKELPFEQDRTILGEQNVKLAEYIVQLESTIDLIRKERDYVWLPVTKRSRTIKAKVAVKDVIEFGYITKFRDENGSELISRTFTHAKDDAGFITKLNESRAEGVKGEIFHLKRILEGNIRRYNAWCRRDLLPIED